jgi:hypothetical protein
MISSVDVTCSQLNANHIPLTNPIDQQNNKPMGDHYTAWPLLIVKKSLRLFHYANKWNEIYAHLIDLAMIVTFSEYGQMPDA